MFSRFRLALGLFAALALAPTVGLGQTPPKPLRNVSVGVGGKAFIPYLPLALADRLGYFRDEGLAVEVNDFEGGSKSFQALVGGSVDIALGAYETAIYLQARGEDITAFVLVNKSYGIVIALTKALAAKYKSPKDLKGLKIGITVPGASADLALMQVLKKAGLGREDVTTINVGSGASAVAAMESGQLDGISHVDPVIAQLVHDGAVVPVIDGRTEQGIKEIYGGYIAGTAFSATPRFIKEHPEIVQAFANAMVRTLKWMHKATLDQIMAQVPPAYYAFNKEVYRESLGKVRGVFSRDGITAASAVATTYKMVVDSGRVPPDRKIDLPKTYDNAFAERANKKY